MLFIPLSLSQRLLLRFLLSSLIRTAQLLLEFMSWTNLQNTPIKEFTSTASTSSFSSAKIKQVPWSYQAPLFLCKVQSQTISNQAISAKSNWLSRETSRSAKSSTWKRLTQRLRPANLPRWWKFWLLSVVKKPWHWQQLRTRCSTSTRKKHRASLWNMLWTRYGRTFIQMPTLMESTGVQLKLSNCVLQKIARKI